jgi:hypothetical protein
VPKTCGYGLPGTCGEREGQPLNMWCGPCLTAEVERLNTALRRLCEEAFHAAAPMTDDGPPLLPALWRELQRANDALNPTAASTAEQEPGQ